MDYELIKEEKDFEFGGNKGEKGIFGKIIRTEFWSVKEFLNLKTYGENMLKNLENDLKNFKDTSKLLESKSFIKELKELKEKQEILARYRLDNLDEVRKGLKEQIEAITKRIDEIKKNIKIVNEVCEKYNLKSEVKDGEHTGSE